MTLSSPRDTVLNTAPKLSVVLTISQVLAALSALFLLGTGGFLLTLGSLGQAGMSDPELAGFIWILVPIFLLGIASVALQFVLLGWGKEWINKAAAESTGSAGHLARLQALSSTLQRWLTWFQWAALVGAALTFLLVPLMGTLMAAMGETGEAAALGAGLGFLIVIPALISAAVYWFFYGSMKSFIGAATARLAGAMTPVLPAANQLGTWLLVFLIFSALSFILQLLGQFVGAGESGESGLALLISLPFALLFSLLPILTLLWMRSYALGLGALLDSSAGGPGNAAAPAYVPAGHLETGKAAPERDLGRMGLEADQAELGSSPEPGRYGRGK
ncbi:hypothetical protein ACFP81_08310 [Deinococcus lacus]|uniref:Glycerophosphoryl diester phosphodiesterase membrane domain-containing protein n=1 Tax=Deinococcus lacus TaxID=392561 RepID=A0ABW1YFG2_9DEIO